jgi:hypothetical protein
MTDDDWTPPHGIERPPSLRAVVHALEAWAGDTDDDRLHRHRLGIARQMIDRLGRQIAVEESYEVHPSHLRRIR